MHDSAQLYTTPDRNYLTGERVEFRVSLCPLKLATKDIYRQDIKECSGTEISLKPQEIIPT